MYGITGGGYASFNRPEMKVERVSYDVMTPSAVRGIIIEKSLSALPLITIFLCGYPFRFLSIWVFNSSARPCACADIQMLKL